MEHVLQGRRSVIVIGAGAAGLMAAVFAARAGASVTVLEAMDRPGKKLLLTGSGRCNLTNLDPELPGRYHGSGAALAETVIRQFTARQTCAFFGELGLLTQEKNGYVYPYTAQASSVLAVLLAELRRLGVKLKLGEKIVEIQSEGKGETSGVFRVATKTWQYRADAVVLACGSCAAPLTGSDGSGYALAGQLGHTLAPVHPALVPLTCRAAYLNALAGVRCRAEISLYKAGYTAAGAAGLDAGALIGRETGELQWTKYGVSGIAVFQLSRFVSCADSEESFYLVLDLLPDYTEEELTELLCGRAEQLREEPVSVLLAGMLQDKLIPVLLSEAGKDFRKKKCGALSAEQLRRLIHTVKHLTLPVSGTKSFDAAQAAAGGVAASELSDTLESRRHPGLYFAGELVDVDGPCGGYNLQWAWSSGRLAGTAAAGSVRFREERRERKR